MRKSIIFSLALALTLPLSSIPDGIVKAETTDTVAAAKDTVPPVLKGVELKKEDGAYSIYITAQDDNSGIDRIELDRMYKNPRGGLAGDDITEITSQDSTGRWYAAINPLYVIDSTTQIYLYDKAGNWSTFYKDKHFTLNYFSKVDEAVAKAEYFLEKNWLFNMDLINEAKSLLDNAQSLVDQSPAGKDKQSNQARLNTVKEKISGQQEQYFLNLATTAVTTAEELKTIGSIGHAQQAIDKLSIGSNKTQLQEKLAAVKAHMHLIGKSYTVQPHDTLYKIAIKNRTTVEALMKANHLSSTMLKVGQVLQLPATYTVLTGDSIYLISKKLGVTVVELLKTNPQVKNPAYIYIGQIINVPQETVKSVETQTYKVKSGDTMYLIAKKLGVRMDNLVAANPQINNPNCVYEGQTLNVPQKQL